MAYEKYIITYMERGEVVDVVCTSHKEAFDFLLDFRDEIEDVKEVVTLVAENGQYVAFDSTEAFISAVMA